MPLTKTKLFKLPDAVFEHCQTVSQRQQLLWELRQIEQYIYSSNKIDIDDYIANNIRLSTREIVKSIIGSEPDLWRERASLAQAALRSLPVVELTLAIEPSAALVTKMYKKIRSWRTEPVVLALKLDNWLIGGLMVVSRGRYKDYSLRQYAQF